MVGKWKILRTYDLVVIVTMHQLPTLKKNGIFDMSVRLAQVYNRQYNDGSPVGVDRYSMTHLTK